MAQRGTIPTILVCLGSNFLFVLTHDFLLNTFVTLRYISALTNYSTPESALTLPTVSPSLSLVSTSLGRPDFSV